jgi:hypothetical protein
MDLEELKNIVCLNKKLFSVPVKNYIIELLINLF